MSVRYLCRAGTHCCTDHRVSVMQTPMQEWYSPICWYCTAGLIVMLVPVMSVTVKVSVCQGLASVVVTMISSPTDQSTGSSNTRTLSPSVTVRARRVHFMLGASPWRSSPPYTAGIRQEHVRMTGNALSVDFHLANTIKVLNLTQLTLDRNMWEWQEMPCLLTFTWQIQLKS